MRQLDLAWAAGLFDGEGHCGARLTSFGTVQIQLQMHQKGRYVLDRLQEILGGKVYENYTRPEIYFWSIGKFSEVVAAIEYMWPYLSEPKQHQIFNALLCKFGEPYEK